MEHARKQIRDAVVSTLTGLATTGANVSVDPVYDIAEASLPALVITTGDESVDITAQFAPRIYQRALNLSIEGIASATSGLADTLDQIAMEVEAAINADATLGGVAMDAVLTSIRQNMEKAAVPIGRLSLDYDITYVTEA